MTGEGEAWHERDDDADAWDGSEPAAAARTGSIRTPEGARQRAPADDPLPAARGREVGRRAGPVDRPQPVGALAASGAAAPRPAGEHAALGADHLLRDRGRRGARRCCRPCTASTAAASWPSRGGSSEIAAAVAAGARSGGGLRRARAAAVVEHHRVGRLGEEQPALERDAGEPAERGERREQRRRPSRRRSAPASVSRSAAAEPEA